MKKTTILSVIGVASAAASATLFFEHYPLPAAIAGLIGYMVILMACKLESANWQGVLLIIAGSTLGFILSGGQSFYPLVISGFCFAAFPVIRGFFWTTLRYTGQFWIEPMLFIMAVGTYIYGNLYDGTGWMSWVFPIPPLLFTMWMMLGKVIDFKQMSALQKVPYGVSLNQPAPDFRLPDHDGAHVSLSDYRDKRHVLLIFVRGDWCPTCHIMLRSYEKNRERFAEKNVMLLAIGPDPVGVNKDMVHRLGIDYKLLSDEKQEAVRAYGMQIQPNMPMTQFTEGIPLPASFLIDIQSRVVFTSSATKAGEILNPEAIFPVLAGL
jgi:peroxiredoxin